MSTANPIANKPARYRYAALQMCDRVGAYVLRRDFKRADRCLRAARRLNHLAYQATPSATV